MSAENEKNSKSPDQKVGETPPAEKTEQASKQESKTFQGSGIEKHGGTK